jgi:hypothetical protein
VFLSACHTISTTVVILACVVVIVFAPVSMQVDNDGSNCYSLILLACFSVSDLSEYRANDSSVSDGVIHVLATIVIV